LWLGADLPLDDADPQRRQQGCVELGELLRRHTAFEALLRSAHRLCDLHQLAETWRQRFNLTLDTAQTLTLIDSLCALVSAARVWRNPEDPAAGVQPFLQVRVQLWLRELRRMVASVGPAPELRHHDDLQNPDSPLHLPVLHCRECHATGWGALRPEGERVIRADLQTFYNAWFARRANVCLMYPLAVNESPPSGAVQFLCPACLTLERGGGECSGCSRPLLRVWVPDLLRQRTVRGEVRVEASNDCPCCQGKAALSILGSRAASMASVAIGDLYGSPFNDDYRLIAFSDSVQDAAHRAGFFGARTYGQVVRQAIARVVREQGETLALSRLVEEVPDHWRRALGSDEEFVGTFIAPDMEWLGDYQRLREGGRLPEGSDLAALVAKRLQWETLVECGLRARIGRTLERSAVATAQVDTAGLSQTATPLASVLREEIGTLREVDERRVVTFLLGFFRRLRHAGAFYHPDMESFVKQRGNTYLLSQRPHLPGYGPLRRPPAALTQGYVSHYFETLFQQTSGWYLGWFNKSLGIDNPLSTAEYQQDR